MMHGQTKIKVVKVLYRHAVYDLK